MSELSGERSFIRWIPDEWRIVAAAALEAIDRGKDLGPAILSAQKVLPTARRRDPEEVYRISKQGSARRYIDEARALTPEERANLLPPKVERKPRAAPEHPRPKMDEGRDYANGMVRWTVREKARLARQINAWREAGDQRALSRLIIEAQELVIDEDRRRPVKSIQAGTASGHNEELLKDGTANIWLLLEEDKRATEAMIEAAEAAEQAAAAVAGCPADAPPATATQEPAIRPEAAFGTPAARSALSEAARAFGDTVMGALDKLLAVHAQTVLDAVNARVSAMATQTSMEIAAMIEQGMRRTVHSLVEHELGGPMGLQDERQTPEETQPEPEQPAAQEAQSAPPETVRAPSLKVDVVGLNHGGMEQQVRHAFNGNTDLRFFDPDSKGSYAPHRNRHCVVVTQRIPHSLKDKIKAAGVEPIFVKSTVGHVIHAIEELHRASGIDMH